VQWLIVQEKTQGMVEEALHHPGVVIPTPPRIKWAC